MDIFIDNTNNSPENNPPGFNCWVGGDKPNGPVGIKVLKTDTHIQYHTDETSLQTWYYDYGWYSGQNIDGPFTEKQVITLPQCSQQK